MNYEKIVASIFTTVKSEENAGALASYIPELANVDSDNFGVYFNIINGENFGIGNHSTTFSIQSIAKVLSLCLAYKLLGEKIWVRLGVEPSGTAFNSLVQLEADKGIPRNPFVNAGALVICDILLSSLEDAKAEFLDFARNVSGNAKLNYSARIANSEKATGYRNIALCNFIKSFGNIKNEPTDVLDLYFNLCSLEMDCKMLSKTFLFLANSGVNTVDGKQVLDKSQTKRINALLQTCGFYDESGEFAFKVGLPGKSGVGGGVVAIYPNQYSIAIWSPKLNKKGNSHRAMRFLELFTTKTEASIF